MHFRFASVWNVPVFSTGGMEDIFRLKDKEYKSLTSLGKLSVTFNQWNYKTLEIDKGKEKDKRLQGLTFELN